jgi:hypothetical protein
MKITDIYESTTAGSIATVAAPMTTQSRNASIYGGKKGGNLLTGKKTNKKYANSVNEGSEDKAHKQGKTHGLKGINDNKYINTRGKEKESKAYIAGHKEGMRLKRETSPIRESKMKELATDIRNMDNGNFKKKYGNTKEHFKASLGDPDAKKTVQEAFIDGFEKYKIVYFDPKKDRTITSSLMAKDEESVWNKCAERGVEVVSIEKVPYKPRKLGEAHLEEDDVIIVPGQGRKLKSGFIPHGESRVDHEVEMARSDLFQAAKNAKQVYEMIQGVSEEEGLEGWVQEKIIKANDYLNSVREYLEGKQLQEMTGGVIAGGGVGESTEHRFTLPDGIAKQYGIDGETYNKLASMAMKVKQMMLQGLHFDQVVAKMNIPAELRNTMREGATNSIRSMFFIQDVKAYQDEHSIDEGLWDNIHAKRERIKKGSGERMRKPGSKGAPSAQDFKDAANEGIVDKIKGAVRREKAKDLPLVQTRRDYAMGKGGDAYNKGETRKGNQYMAYAEKDRKKKGDPTTNPAGTYRTKTSDYTNEAQTMSGALKNTLAKAEPGSKLDQSIKRHSANIKAGYEGTLKNAPTGYHFDKKGYCRLGDN